MQSKVKGVKSAKGRCGVKDSFRYSTHCSWMRGNVEGRTSILNAVLVRGIVLKWPRMDKKRHGVPGLFHYSHQVFRRVGKS
jgi:hypothetical protein